MRDLKKFLSLKSADRVLDLGRGSGEWVLDLAPECAYVTGLGLTEDDTAAASARAIQAGAANVSFQWVGEDGIGGIKVKNGMTGATLIDCLTTDNVEYTTVLKWR